MVVQAQSQAEQKEFRGIVRIMGKDLKGQLPLATALSKIRGIGSNLANALAFEIEREYRIARSTRVGDLSEKQISFVEETIREPRKHLIPTFLLNRQRYLESGEAKHVVQADLAIAVRQDVEREKNFRTWRGWRHSIGQRVRGQHTRTTGRTGMTVGVLKKAIKAQKEAAAKAAQEKTPSKEAKK